MRALVIGGRGFFGAQVARALRAGGADVTIGGRRAELAIDVARVEPSALSRFDAVVNCSDTLKSPPDHLHEAAIEAGVLYAEPTADPGPIQRALARRGSLNGRGVAVLGLGIFPGLSNLAAHAVFDDNGRRGPIEVGMQFSPLSGAGGSMVALITHLMAEPAPYYMNGTRQTAPAFSKGAAMPYDGDWIGSLRAAIPETDLLHATLGVPDVVAVLSPQPTVFQPVLRAVARLIPPWPLLRRPGLALFRAAIGLVRRGLFRNRPTRVVVSAVAGRRGDARDGRYLNLATPDGVSCGAFAIAASLRLISARRPQPGTYVLDELVGLDELLGEIASIPGAPPITRRSSHEPAAAAAAPTG
jgi:hypothetical protein